MAQEEIMGYWNYYPPYVSVAEKRTKAARKLKQLKKKNPDILSGFFV